MTQYGKAAIKAAELRRDDVDMSPQNAWKEAVSIFTDSTSSQKKVCPRNTFLGLCEAGMIIGVDPGEYCAGERCKAFAIRSVEILRDDRTLSDNKKELWKKVMKELGEDTSKSENDRMDVVISLWPDWIRNGGNR